MARDLSKIYTFDMFMKRYNRAIGRRETPIQGDWLNRSRTTDAINQKDIEKYMEHIPGGYEGFLKKEYQSNLAHYQKHYDTNAAVRANFADFVAEDDPLLTQKGMERMSLLAGEFAAKGKKFGIIEEAGRKERLDYVKKLKAGSGRQSTILGNPNTMLGTNMKNFLG